MEHLQSFREPVSKILRNIEKETKLKALQGFTEELESFKQRINDDFFRLAVIGEFSSGKSTFINALIGKDILSHATKETTAVLTRIVNVADDDPRKESAVAFMKNGQELPIKNLDELKEYTTAVSTKFQVAKEIEAVEIYMPLMHTNCPLMIMDTPGLNGIVEGHLEQTKDIVTKAHACIYLLQQRGLTKDDIEFLTTNLVPCQRRFIFVQNFIDEFKSSEGETLDDKINFLRQTLTEKVFGNSTEHKFFICGISALKELASRDTQIKRLYATDTEDLTGEDRKNLAVESNFSSFKSILTENFSESNLEEIQYHDTAVAILHWIKNLNEKISWRILEDSEIYRTIREKNVADKIEHLVQKIRDRRTDNLSAIHRFISGEIRKINKELEKIIENRSNELEKKLAKEINACNSPEEIERKRTRLPNDISRGVEQMGLDTVDYCKISFQELHQRVMERVEEYSGILPPEVGENFSVTLNVEQKKFHSENHIERYKDEIRQKEAAIVSEKYTAGKANSKLKDQEANVRNINSDVADAQQRINQKQNEIRLMGARPEEKVWTEIVERSGFFGTIRDLFGKEEVELRDDSAGISWDNQRRELQDQQNNLSNQLNKSLKEKSAAERVLNRYRQDARDSAEKIRRLENEINQLEGRIKTETARIRKEESVARENFVRMCKNQLREKISTYFHGDLNDGVTTRLLDELKKRTSEFERKISTEAENNFNESIDKKLAELEQITKGNIAFLQKKITGLEQSGRNLESYAKRMEEILNE